ncbi:hypothetical protein HETIRDRAFT_407575 [Heterobasidion irregulare TC 32-1]|uniref:JmjC domain-containing histone demethylation protein 1 n=1 Tax=Heterobasidion irregulare (strain TC 32-1) TaxID=747525 RepID=W4KKM7_HETIT|nr:uncharacterized protein HETIRDRAFT_407575 [Heterobasidion irregulare TC 32-1]ETW85621.1 hypothetical protein HETIRDRAFT_407575 [Heterobasidion irregulare TC 32-1]
MARPTRRRTTRSTAHIDPEPKADSPHSSATSVSDVTKPARADDDRCPACKNENVEDLASIKKENWIRCDACRAWFHWRCLNESGDLDTIDKWFCTSCQEQDPSRTKTLKPPARKSTRKKLAHDYANMHTGLSSSDPNRWLNMLQGKSIAKDHFKRLNGEQVNLDWVNGDPDGFREPVVIEEPEGLGMKMPGRDLSIESIADTLGRDTPVEVIDVASQSNSPGWTLGKWAGYWSTESASRDKVRNVISLEVSGTKLADEILPPRLVREMDWVEKYWPNNKKGPGQVYPKVQLYCLMGVAGAWTDWHIDFAGSSVYYHILRGSKVFYFIRPTPSNLAAYERWSGSDVQSHTWLGDMVDNVVKVELSEGNTMLIPSGWIHAVYTPIDTLVFGGNFLHSYDVAIQLRVREIENVTRVPKKFRFPFFTKMCWYVGERYLRDLKAREEFSERILQSLDALAGYLVLEARALERGPEASKREAREQLPSDKVKDASAVARELRWRVKLASGDFSDDEDDDRLTRNHEQSSAYKRKREERNSPESCQDPISTFRHFQPKIWDGVSSEVIVSQQKSRTRSNFEEERWMDAWLDWNKELLGSAEDGVAVNRKRHVVVKVRRTAKGLERHRVERVIEEWDWTSPPNRLNNLLADEDSHMDF